MLPAASTAYSKCRAAPSCKGDDQCVADAGRAMGGSDADKYVSDCAARVSACNGAFSGEYCSTSLFAYPGTGALAQSCLAKACGEIVACITASDSLQRVAACKKR